MQTATKHHEAKTRTSRSQMAAVLALAVSAAVLPAMGAPTPATAENASVIAPHSVTTAGPNLIKDPELVNGTAAWSVGAGGKLGIVKGYNGHRAIAVLNTTSAAKTLGINDRLNTVTTTRAGAVYRAQAWIKTWSTIAGGTRQMEYTGTACKGSKVSRASFSTAAWKRVTVDYKAATTGASIDFNVLAWALPAHTHLLMSSPRLVRLTTTTSAPTPSSPTGYKLVFHDDFNTVDRTKWNVRNNSWAHNEESMVTSRATNVFTSNGALTLRAVHENYTAYGTTRHYTSGYLDTIGKESWRYGRMEMRAKLPAAQGMWPAFWLREGNGGLGELDIMEAVGGMTKTTVQTVHQSTNGDMGKSGHEDVLASGSTSDWHTYAVDREPGFVKWYVDGRLVFCKTVSALSWLDSAFNEPMNIRLNLQVGGGMPNYYKKPVVGAPLGKSDFVIDYVRVYQKS